ncbi:porin, partial [Burkholderia ubonensis]
MKKTLIVAALSGVFATAAHAQSSVTLYGLIDAGITYTNNQGGHSAWQQSTGSVNGSRWGLRGAEDLGGGLKAIFTLENGFGINNGTLKQNGREFGRQAFVGLSHSVYGSVTLGRQYDSVVDYLGPLSLTGTQYGGTQFAHPFDNDNLNNSFRINNAVKYQSADYNGLKFGALYGFSNSSNFANNRAYSVGASYSFMGFNVAAAYMQLNNNVNGLAQAVSDPGAVAGDWTFAASRQRTWGAGLNYSFGPATAGFVFTQTRLTDSVAISAGQSGVTGGITSLSGGTRFNNYEINGRYALTPALSLAGSYTYTDGRIVGQSPKWHQFNLQAAYALSKRTDVYLQGEYQKVNSDGLPLRANINGLGTASSN